MKELNNNTKSCPLCGGIITGRSDRRFCSLQCKNAWHHAKNKEKQMVFNPVDRIVHRNRDALKAFYQYSQGTRYVPVDRLLKKGFQLEHYQRKIMNQNGTGENLYIVYDYAFVYNHSKGVKIFYRWMFPSL